jgi:hypothetical protein
MFEMLFRRDQGLVYSETERHNEKERRLVTYRYGRDRPFAKIKKGAKRNEIGRSGLVFSASTVSSTFQKWSYK